MPNDIYQIPPSLRGGPLVVVFIIAVILFHWLLVYQWLLNRIGFRPLGKRGWKIVDYIWLGVGATALIGTAFSARQFLANEMLKSFDSTITQGVDVVHQWTDPKSYDGLLCRKFVRSGNFPSDDDFNRVQAEYDRKCAWVKAVGDQVKDVRLLEHIDASKLPPTPLDQNGKIDPYVTEVLDTIKTHNDVANRRRLLEEELQRSEFEETMALLSPLLAVLALALRITKVTGEIRLG